MNGNSGEKSWMLAVLFQTCPILPRVRSSWVSLFWSSVTSVLLHLLRWRNLNCSWHRAIGFIDTCRSFGSWGRLEIRRCSSCSTKLQETWVKVSTALRERCLFTFFWFHISWNCVGQDPSEANVYIPTRAKRNQKRKRLSCCTTSAIDLEGPWCSKPKTTWAQLKLDHRPHDLGSSRTTWTTRTTRTTTNPAAT